MNMESITVVVALRSSNSNSLKYNKPNTFMANFKFIESLFRRYGD